jgi:anti-sigma28 factor (negative regulator of flagellin synthesis)
MRIAPKTGTTPAENTATKMSAETAPTPEEVHTGDGTELRTLEEKAASLATKMNQIPEIPHDKLTDLAHSIQTGTYQVSPEQTAEAILSELPERDSNAA